MLFLSCNSTRSSKDAASLGFTSVSSPWEVVYYFQPGITGQSQGSSLGSRIIGNCQNTASVLGRRRRDAARGDAGMGLRWPGCCAPVGMLRWDAGCCWAAGQAQPPALSAQPMAPLRAGGKQWDPFQERGVLEPIFGCCASSKFGFLLINTGAVSVALLGKTWGCCRVGYSGGFFSTLYERPRSVWRAGGEGRWRKGWRAEGRVRCSELLCAGALRSPPAGWGGGTALGAAPVPAHEGTGADTVPRGPGRLCRARRIRGMVFPSPFPRQRQPSGFLQGGACPRLGRAWRRKRGSLVLK